MARLPLQASVDLQQELRRISIPTHLAKSSVLFTQGDRAKGVYLIESGSVALTLKLYRGGITVHHRTLGKGSLLGLPATMNDTAYSLTATASCEVDLAFIPRDKLIETANQNLSLAIDILKVLSYEVHDMREVIRTRGRPGGSPGKARFSSSGRSIDRGRR
jgi:CRP-like cAMP-binding protein